MFCSNIGCGIPVDGKNEMCHLCKKCVDIDGMIHEKCSELDEIVLNLGKCKKCVEINKLKKCDFCGKDRMDKHRLCTYCASRTQPCKLCYYNRVKNDRIKYCRECILKVDVCSYIDCNEKLYGNYCCQKHCCKNNNCLNIINQIGKNPIFCYKCTCRMCDKNKIENSDYCIDHKCRFKGCTIYYSDCAHKCKYPRCGDSIDFENFRDSEAFGDSEACKKHKCQFCNKMICHNYNGEGSLFCTAHKCEISDCLDSKYQNKRICKKHACVSKNCKDINVREHVFICKYDYKNNVFCAKCDAENCEIMLLTKGLIIDRSKIDIALVWKKICINECLMRFRQGFQKSALILMFKLKTEEVPKDIRRLLFYKYLVTTLIYYFSKNCYNCAKVCSANCEIGWPGNSKCKKHHCLVSDCTNVKCKKYDTKADKTGKNVKSEDQCGRSERLQTDRTTHLKCEVCRKCRKGEKCEKSNYCVEHRCVKCDNLAYKDRDCCNNHLCPLCRKISCVGDKKFCKNCRCKQYIPSGYGDYNKRCENPVHIGSKYCEEHNF